MSIDLEKINLSPKTLEEAAETIGCLVKIIIELKKENDSLKEKLNNNSKNSSLPPSQDLKKKKQIKPKSGRKPGGQPGHKAHQRELVSLEQVSEVIACKPETTCDCGGVVNLKKTVARHQVYEIPQAKYEVIEYQIYKGCCASCKRAYCGELPAGVSRKGFGPRTLAMLSLLTSKYRLSKRQVQDWFKDVYQMPLCLGSVSNIEHTVSKSLERSHEEILSDVRKEQVIHLDETGHKECNKSAWAWIMSTQGHTYFKLNRSRGRKVAKELIGNHHGHIYVTDRYSAYNYLPDKNRQVCWAHLKRDFQKISERSGVPGKIGKQLLKSYEQLFRFWKTEYDPESRLFKKQKKRLRYFKAKLLRYLRLGVYCGHKTTARTCKNILGTAEGLWNFFEVVGVPPTNNHAERQLRPLVISKKLTFGTQSERGSRFIERIFSVVTTCRQQKQDVLVLVTNLIKQYFTPQMAQPLGVFQ